MASAPLGAVLRHVRGIAAAHRRKSETDGGLLRSFRDGDESAFAALVKRHGPMVLGVCRRVLHQLQDAEDAFQATFLLLARDVNSLGKLESLGGWLHGVAYRMACNARRTASRRRRHEGRARPMPQTGPEGELAWREVRTALDEEVQRLPAIYRDAFVLCCLQDRSGADAARALGVKEGTLGSRLNKARALLREALARRGLSPSAVLAAVAVTAGASQAAVPVSLVTSTVRAATLVVAGKALGAGLLPANVVSLLKGAKAAMILVQPKSAALLVLALALTGAGVGLCAYERTSAAAPPVQSAPLENPPAAAAPRAEPQDRAKSENHPAEGEDALGDPLPPGAVARLGTVRLRHGSQVHSLALAGDGKTAVSGGMDSRICLWDLTTGKRVRDRTLRPAGSGFVVAMTRDGKTVAVAGEAGHVLLSDAGLREEPRRIDLPGGAQPAQALAFSGDGTVLAVGTWEGPISLWDPATGKQVSKLEGHQDRVGSLAFSGDGKRLISGAADKAVKVWDIETGKEVRSFSGHDKPVLSAALSPDGTLAASGGMDQTLRVWDIKTGKELHQAKPHEYGVSAVAFRPDGKTLASAGWDGKIFLWEVGTWKQSKQLPGHRTGVSSLQWTEDGKRLVSGGWDNTIRVWDPVAGKELLTFGGHVGRVVSVHFTADGQRLLTAGEDGTVRVWDRKTGRELASQDASDKPVFQAAFAPDGKSVALGAGRSITLREVATGAELRRLEGHEGNVMALAFSPDGKTLASGAEDQTIRLWEVRSGKETRRLSGHKGAVAALAFSPDGLVLASGSSAGWGGPDSSVRLWSVAEGKELPALQDREVPTLGVAFSPDGTLLATANEDFRIRLWDRASGKLLRQWQADAHFSGPFPGRS